jgi:lysophospholipase L1-like esterase
MGKKKVLCFGDSNTFGYIPASGKRYGSDIRWTSKLKKYLGDDYEIIEAGCNNRTCFANNPDGDNFIGLRAIKKYHGLNVDYFILSLGANDIQLFFNPTKEEIEHGVSKLIEDIKTNFSSKIILVCPPLLSDDVLRGNFSYQFDEISVEKSKILPEIYKKLAERYGCIYVDWNDEIKPSELDGLHYSPQSHEKISKIFTEIISNV